MKILVVCSYRDYVADGMAPFIKEQVNALCNIGVRCEFYLIKGKGAIGYFKELPGIRKTIREYKPDVIHAHFGLSGLLANFATKRIPVVTTYHGSDINNPSVYRYSKYAICLSKWNIFVSRKNMEIAGAIEGKKASLIPCGVDETLFYPMDKVKCREEIGLEQDKKYVLFSKAFTVEVKDYPLAKATIERTNEFCDEGIELLEFKGYSRKQSAMLINAVDALLLTSKTEGSPQIIKEAMACGCPIVSVDVGDVAERLNGIEGCYLAKSRHPEELADLLKIALEYNGRTKGREVLMKQNLSNGQIAEQIYKVYEHVKNV